MVIPYFTSCRTGFLTIPTTDWTYHHRLLSLTKYRIDPTNDSGSVITWDQRTDMPYNVGSILYLVNALGYSSFVSVDCFFSSINCVYLNAKKTSIYLNGPFFQTKYIFSIVYYTKKLTNGVTMTSGIINCMKTSGFYFDYLKIKF